MPKLHSRIDTQYGHDGVVREVGASHFIVRYYGEGDYTLYICDEWEYSK